MVDTVKLYIEDFEIDSSCPITVQSGTFNLDGEMENENALFRVNGKTFFGAKAYLNTDCFRFDINSKGAFVSTEIPLWYGETNFLPVSLEQVSDFSYTIKKELSENGIYTDIEDSKLSRIDLFRNGEMKHYPFEYFPVLRTCRGRRVHRRDYGDTMTFFNTRREGCFYDKYTQMESKGQSISEVPRNSLRGEVRLKTGNSIRKFTGGMERFRDIKEGFGDLPVIYRKQLEDMIFRYGIDTPEQLDFFDTDLKILKFLKKKHDKYAFTEWIKGEGVVSILERYGDIENVRQLLLQVFTRGAVSKQLKRIEDMIKEMEWLDVGKVHFIDLYNEMKETFLNVV